jgi:asparagine synthase (glutamine-hydrolysing)
MPGIAGLISADPFAAKHLDRMASCLVHEPTYASGTYRHAAMGVHVGWAVHGGSFADCMPIWNETNDVCLFVCGEVFTDASELDSLTRRGHRFVASDASHLVHLYEEDGQAFVERLNGWFSGLIVDLRRSTATLFNDRYGVGRIYLRETDDGLYFSSEAKSLLRIFSEMRRLDTAAVAETFSFGCVLQNRTLFNGISLLPPASIWTIDRMVTVQRRTYFDPKTWEAQDPLPDDRFCSEFERAFSGLLPQYFRGPAAAMSLTGGLDGRMIMAWARQAPGTLPCYSFGSSYRDCQDVTLARAIARSCGQSHRTIVAGPQMLADFPALAARCIFMSDGAMDVSGAVELYVNRLAREIAPVRLTGNYGSEIVRGNVAFRPRRFDAAILDPGFRQHLDAAAQTYRAERDVADLSFVAFKQVPWHHHARLSVEQSQLTMRSPFLDNRLVALMFRASPQVRQSKTASLRLIHDGNPTLACIPTDRGVVYGAPTLAGKLRNTMLEFMAKAEYAYDYGMPQWLATTDRALSSLQLERLFLGRQKFYHFRVWYRRQLAPYVRDMLLSPQGRARAYFGAGALERMVDSHTRGSANHTLTIHRALTLELIHQQLLDPSAGALAAGQPDSRG